MTRLKISIAVLSTLIRFSFFNTLTVKYKCNYMLESIEEIKKTASSDKEKAVELSKDLKKYWDKNSDYLNLLVSSDYLGEIGIVFSNLMNLFLMIHLNLMLNLTPLLNL